ncbi:MAG: 4-(cytidine 5'-diphospho)-2-C-methyl-D-erythritol kinase [Deltaproteobacteria bacterium]|nr:4-(cytidine 5'-diphospho)-2-C-methyl-D-erythritol kinase [Deltaproteobacteria bacterium]
MKSLKVFSPAKLNLSLFIGKKRKDGFHTIYSLMIPLKSLGDTFIFSKTDQKKITLHADLSLPQKQNLVWKAANLFFKKTRLTPSHSIQIQKKIPLGAGLGGGSSNAATTLLALNKLYGSPLSFQVLKKLALQLGSDVPFFLYNKPAYVGGRGEKIKPLKLPLKEWFLVLNPGFPISTPWAYDQWDKANRANSLTKKRGDVKNYTFFLKKGPWKNDFEKVIFTAYPQLEEAKQDLMRLGASMAGLSGSGPSLYGIFEKKSLAQKAAKYFDKQNWLVWVTQGRS